MTTPGTEIATRPVGALTLDPHQTEWTERQRAALDQLGVAEAPDGDKAVFLHQAQRTGLDPFAKQIYMIGRFDAQAGKKKWTIQTGIDGFRIVAERHGQYGGQVGPQWCGDDGQWRDVWPHKKPPVAARVGIRRHDWTEPVFAVAHFHEYAQTKGNGLTRMWADKPAVMIAKCAEALALRKAFPHDLSGLYTAEEMSRAEDVVRVESERPDAPAATAPSLPAQTGVDWDAELKSAAGNLDALKLLWQKAGTVDPDNDALAHRIRAAVRDAKATAEAEPVDAEVVEEDQAQPAEPTADVTNTEPAANQAQKTAIAAALGEHNVKGREDRLAVISFLIGDRIATSDQLTKSEASHVLDAIAKQAESGDLAATIQAAIAAWSTHTEKVPA